MLGEDAEYCRILAEHMATLPDTETRSTTATSTPYTSRALHDVGKVGIPANSILLKPENLLSKSMRL